MSPVHPSPVLYTIATRAKKIIPFGSVDLCLFISQLTSILPGQLLLLPPFYTFFLTSFSLIVHLSHP